MLFPGGDPFDESPEISPLRFQNMPAPPGFTQIIRPGDIPGPDDSTSLINDSLINYSTSLINDSLALLECISLSGPLVETPELLCQSDYFVYSVCFRGLDLPTCGGLCLVVWGHFI